MFNVGFLSSGVTRACLNAVGKMPVRRDVLMMCVSAGKSVGEIAWRRCEGIGSRGHPPPPHSSVSPACGI